MRSSRNPRDGHIATEVRPPTAVVAGDNDDPAPNTLRLDSTLRVLLDEVSETAQAALELVERAGQVPAGSDDQGDALIELAVVLLDLSSDAQNAHEYVNVLIDREPIEPTDEETAQEDLRPEPESLLYWSLAEASRASGLAVTTLRNQIHNGRLKAVKIGRNWIVTRTSVEQYLGSRRINAKPVKLREHVAVPSRPPVWRTRRPQL